MGVRGVVEEGLEEEERAVAEGVVLEFLERCLPIGGLGKWVVCLSGR